MMKMLELKQLDIQAYREIKKRFLNIDKMYSNSVEEKDISLRNTYQNIKNEKKRVFKYVVQNILCLCNWSGNFYDTGLLK